MLYVKLASILSLAVLVFTVRAIGDEYQEVLEMLSRQHEMFLVAQTVILEAEGEPYLGKLGVAYVIMNRAVFWRKTIPQVVYDPYEFSAYNPRSGRAVNLGNLPDHVWRAAERAAASAYFNLEPDPTFGSTHYMNVPVVKATRPDGKLPKWAKEMEEVITIGNHTFYREK